MSPMRGRASTAIGFLVSASLVVTLFCPCAMAPAPALAADAHGCCPVETGLRPADPGCCAESTGPKPGASLTATAPASAQAPGTFVLATLPSVPLNAEAPQACGVAGAPPLVLRI
jgi:hypothetical protein